MTVTDQMGCRGNLNGATTFSTKTLSIMTFSITINETQHSA